tara:strand:- start:46 stop:285 length:240 start_codon:yes stop_codon:yes gene_type:complete
MSENNDILEFIVQCLLNHRIENEQSSKNLKGNNYIIDATKNNLLKRNIHYTIQQQFNHENLDSNYGKFELSNYDCNLNF